MEILFLLLLLLTMAGALGAGFPVAFALPGSAIITIGAAALAGWVFTGSPDAFFVQGGPSEWINAGVTNFRGVYWEVERDTLIAIPLFVFMGIMLQRSRIAEDLLVTMAQLFGPVRGGLGISVVVVGALLAATTGIVGATVVAMGLISLPAMLRNNYSHSLATGTIAASGTLGQIIPPSIVLIILADQLASAADQASTTRKALYKAATGELSMPSEFDLVSTSAGEMFLGALLPGLLLVGLYIVFIAVFAFLKPETAPAVPYEGERDLRFVGRVLLILVPPLALIFIVLGSIIMGVATVNQAGAIGAAGALIMGGYRLREGKRGAYWPAILALAAVAVIVVATQLHPINIKNVQTDADVAWLVTALIAVALLLVALVVSAVRVYHVDGTLRSVMVDTAKTTSLVFIILLGAAMLTAAFRAFGGEELVRDFLTGLPGGFWGQFAIVMLVIFLLGFFLDFIEIAVVVVPIVAPILLADPGANVTAVWLGVMVGLNIQTSFLTPPFGFALFYLRGVAPKIVKTVSMYKGVVAFIGLQVLALAVVAYTPRLVNYLPTRISLTSETAPPPINPKLQHCLELYVFDEYAQREDELRAAMRRAAALDLGTLPRDLRKDLEEALELAPRTFELRDEVLAARAAVEDASGDYEPLHGEVRDIQAAILQLDNEKEELELEQRLSQTAPDSPRAQKRASRLEAIDAEIKALNAHIPPQWKAAHEAFAELLAAERKARRAYQRNVDDAYEPVREIVTLMAQADQLAALRAEVLAIGEVVRTQPPEQVDETLSALESSVGDVEGARDIRSAISKVRRAASGRSPDPEKALGLVPRATQAFEEDAAWRQQAAAELLPALQSYELAIRDTVGLRQMDRLPREQALGITGCMAQHRDVSLYF